MEISDEHLGIIQEALSDFRRWFDGDDESDIAYREIIDVVLDAVS
jgi:hypothetical protein